MGFLSRDKVLSFQREENNIIMRKWVTKYPITAEIMFGNLEGKEKEDYIIKCLGRENG